MARGGRRSHPTEKGRAAKTDEARRRPDQPSMPDWNAIRADVVAGVSTRAAAKKHGVSYSTLAKRAAREGWEQARKQVGSAVAAATDAHIAKEHAMDAIAAARDGDRVAGKIEQLAESLADALREELAKVTASKKRRRSLESLTFALDALARSHGKAHNTRRLALRMDADDASPRSRSLLDSIIDELVESGEIKGPAANVSSGASSDGGSPTETSRAQALDEDTEAA